MGKNMETATVYGDNGKEHGICHSILGSCYRDSGKENGNYYLGVGDKV